MKRVDPGVYTEEYYLTDCTGSEEFKNSYGELLEPRLREIVKHIRIQSGMRVLDIGCGRGEMVFYAATNGACAVGIDYAKEAIKLANKLKEKKEKHIRGKMKFYLMDAKKITLPISSFDVVILTDVVEHLYDEELDRIFREIKRVLKKDGVLVIHTAPNKLFFNVGYKVYTYPVAKFLVGIWNVIARSHYPSIANPRDLRAESHSIMHINEPTYFSLKQLLKKHDFVGRLFSSNIVSKKPTIGVKDVLFNCIVYLHPFSTRFPLNMLFGSDFIAVVKNKK